MEDKQILLDNISKVRTTEMGIDRIKKNLKLNTDDVVEFCKKENKRLINDLAIMFPNAFLCALYIKTIER